jgi:glucoamylase
MAENDNTRRLIVHHARQEYPAPSAERMRSAPQTVQRYLVEKTGSPYVVWRFNNKSDVMPAGKTLRIETLASTVIHWSAHGWRTVHDTDSLNTGMGVHVADLPTEALPRGAQILFTFFWPEARRWEGEDFTVQTGWQPAVGRANR